MKRHSVIVAAFLLAVAGAALAGVRVSAGDEGVPFALGAVKDLTPGTAYVYEVRMDKAWLNPAASPPRPGTEYTTEYARIVVTDVLAVDTAVRVKARVDKLDEKGNLLKAGLYSLLLANRDEHTLAQVSDSDGIPAGPSGSIEGLPCFVLGYPPLQGLPAAGVAPQVARWQAAGSSAVRYSPTLDREKGTVVVDVTFYRIASESDREKGKPIVYAQRGKDVLLGSVPMGVEAAPLLTKTGFPREKYGEPDRYQVFAVTPDMTETQQWQAGAAFPSDIIGRTADGRQMLWSKPGDLLFEAKLIRTVQVALDDSARVPVPAGGAAPTK